MTLWYLLFMNLTLLEIYFWSRTVHIFHRTDIVWWCVFEKLYVIIWNSNWYSRFLLYTDLPTEHVDKKVLYHIIWCSFLQESLLLITFHAIDGCLFGLMEHCLILSLLVESFSAFKAHWHLTYNFIIKIS